MSKVLLINPSYRDSYGSAKAAMIDPVFPTLSLLTIAAMAEQRGHAVEILDMSYMQYDYRIVRDKILTYKPDIIGITATTPLVNQMRDISVLVKSISQDILVVGGGSHISAMPTESMKESMLDIAAVGEADITFADIVDGRSPETIFGIYYRKGEAILSTPPRPFIQNLDDLPMPAWHLYDSQDYKYKISRLLAKRPPLAMAEFSRGCVFKCDFCASKNTMALGYRKKSPERCAEEVRLMHHYGYREFALADDIFTSDPTWAKSVSRAIINTGIDMAWTCTNGIRVESADNELFQTMRKAGCYRVAFGFESGNDKVLKMFGKGGKASIEKGREAVHMARAAGIDTTGYFMLGLSPDTEESMRDTIEYARSLSLDMMKFGIAIAFPGTPMFKEYRQKGMIRSYNWDDYFIYSEQPLFSHANLTFEKVQEFASYAYRRAVLTNPAFILRRLWRGIRTKEFFWDGYYFMKFITAPPINNKVHSAVYFARDRWPVYDFANQPITFYAARPATNKLTPELLQGVTI
ncbi:MAG: radical SAM protein [Gammaproteobacteria bacterium RIFCSPHIGHO2_12_FULL_37_14]|nr:MAG: radical SAM protein [Gammaproteobacteria bacterium RIFCSPHIGHO2_12_FULL_37_14]